MAIKDPEAFHFNLISYVVVIIIIMMDINLSSFQQHLMDLLIDDLWDRKMILLQHGMELINISLRSIMIIVKP